MSILRIKKETRLTKKIQNVNKFTKIIYKTGIFRWSNYRKSDHGMHTIAKNLDQNLNLGLYCNCKSNMNPDKMIHFKAGILRRQKQLQI